MKNQAAVLLAQYFDELYPLASAFNYAGGSVGLMVCAPFAQLLLEVYGWRGTLLLLGGMNFHIMVCCALFRPHATNEYTQADTASTSLYSDEETCSSSESDSGEDSAFGWRKNSISSKQKVAETWVHFFGLSLFENFSFVANCLATSCFVTAISGWTVYFVPHCIAKGLTPYESTFAATLVGGTYLFGFFVHVPFLKRNLYSVKCAIYLSGVSSGIALLLEYFNSTFVGIVITNSIFICGVAVMCMLEVHLRSIVDQEDLAKAFGWRTAVCGLFRALPGFLIGKMFFDVRTQE